MDTVLSFLDRHYPQYKLQVINSSKSQKKDVTLSPKGELHLMHVILPDGEQMVLLITPHKIVPLLQFDRDTLKNMIGCVLDAKCGICLNDAPQGYPCLQCGHVLCLQCMLKLMTCAYDEDRDLDCPLCRFKVMSHEDLGKTLPNFTEWLLNKE